MKQFIRFQVLYLMINRPKAFLIIFLALSYSSTAAIAKADEPPHFRFKTIVIDAGHGGKDPGAHGSHSLEKNVALAIAKKLNLLVKQELPEVNVIMTRSTDRFIELKRRSEIANENHANLFISIHCNSSPEGTAESAHKEKGTMILVYGFHRKQEQMEALRENSSIYIEKDYKKNYDGYSEKDPTALIILNAYMEKYRHQSILFGQLVNKQFVNNDGRRSLGVKEQGVLVLAHSAMPAVLIETGYINNPGEEKYLNSEAGQNAIAHSILRAIKKYRRDIQTQ